MRLQVAALALLLGCDSEDTEDSGALTEAALCIGAHPASGDVADNADDVATECDSSGGTGCDVSGYLSAEAATCIAEADGLAAGVADWSSWLVYHNTHQRPVWNVDQTTYEDAGSAGGDALSLDAVSGAVLSRSSWERE